MANRNETKEWILIILGLLIMGPIMVMAIGSVAIDFLKLVFVDNLGETVKTIGIVALILGGIYIVGQVFGSSSGSKSKHSTNRTGEYPYNWDSIRADVLKRDGHRCGNCGSSTSLHVHHIVPLSKGGTNNPSNLRTLCEDCHKLLHPHMRR